MSNPLGDTIIALSTPQGEGAIAVIRLSGFNAITIVDAYFHGKSLVDVPSHTVHYGKIKDESGRILDECLISVFRAPRSYTRENVVEISCHGSPYIIQQILLLFIRHGVRQAEPGEFTLRAFLNGQLDLSQAEAVGDLIAADSSISHDLAMQQMRGGFADNIKVLRQELIDFAALIELELDFGEEDVEFADRDKLEKLVLKIKNVISSLIDSFALGNILKNGVPTVIAGRPNAGKSTLLNVLLNEDRAIVSEIPGTTRDTIEETLTINGIVYRLIDTAGIRQAQDQIEAIGIDKTKEKISKAQIVMYIYDVIETTPQQLWQDASTYLGNNDQIFNPDKIVFIANKMDLNPYTSPEDYYKEGMIDKNNLITLSAKNKMNISYLKDHLYQMVIDHPQALNQTIVTNTRHYQALRDTISSLDKVLDGLVTGVTGDFIAMDIRSALRALGAITGEIYTDDLLDSIFGRFCIGK